MASSAVCEKATWALRSVNKVVIIKFFIFRILNNYNEKEVITYLRLREEVELLLLPDERELLEEEDECETVEEDRCTEDDDERETVEEERRTEDEDVFECELKWGDELPPLLTAEFLLREPDLLLPDLVDDDVPRRAVDFDALRAGL